MADRTRIVICLVDGKVSEVISSDDISVMAIDSFCKYKPTTRQIANDGTVKVYANFKEIDEAKKA